jgi:hypothetical protein
MQPKRIDVHYHIFPEQYVHALKEAGVKNTYGVEFQKWSLRR